MVLPPTNFITIRFNQTIKRMVYAHMLRYQTNVWADVLQVLIDNYNTTPHLSTGYTPEYLHRSSDSQAIDKAKNKMEKRNLKWMKTYGKQFPPVKRGDPVRLSNLVFKDLRRAEALVSHSYTPSWSDKIYNVVSISHPKIPEQQPQYTVEDPQSAKRLRIFRDNIQLLPGQIPRITDISSRPTYPDFFYREEQRNRARASVGGYEYPPVAPLQITEESRRRRRPSVMFKDFYLTE